MAYILITQRKLILAEVEALVQDPSAGAVVCFEGTTRRFHLGRCVRYLEYEAQERLAVKTLISICDEATRKFGLAKTAVHHRLGRLEIGEASVIIGASSEHRAAAFDGCRFLIDTVKSSVPIWKKEYYEDELAAEWIGPDGNPVK